MDGMDAFSPGLSARLALNKHGFRFTHALGQNFILDDDLMARIVDASGVAAGENVLEIGAGAGVLTRHLYERGARVTAVEVDKSLEPVLSDVLGPRDIRLVFADIMKADIPALMGDEPYQVVANLPYYMTADVILRLLTCPRPPRRATVMVQREASERMMAQPGSKTWCALAATVQYLSKPQALMDVPPEAFTPPPHVDSVLLSLDVYPPDEKPFSARDQGMMLKVISAAFAMRRKTLLNNLCAAFSVPRETAAAWIERAGQDIRVRGEALDIPELAVLSDIISDALA